MQDFDQKSPGLVVPDSPFALIKQVVQLATVDLIVAGPDMQHAIGLVPVLCQGKEIGAGELVETRLGLGA